MGRSEVSVRPWTDVEEILAVLEPLEPAATPLVGPTLERGLSSHHRIWRASTRGVDQPLAVLGSTRICLDRWISTLIELEPGSSASFLPLLRRLPARRIGGLSTAMAPLVTGLRPAQKASFLPFIDLPVPVPVLGPLDPRTRLAGSDDLAPLVELSAGTIAEALPTKPRLRRYLDGAVAHDRVLVLEDGGEIVATQRIDHLSRRYGWLGALIVRPDRRGEGLSWQMANAGLHHLVGLDVGAASTYGATNTMRVTGDRARLGEELMGQRPELDANLRPWLSDPDTIDDATPSWCSVLFGRRRSVPGSSRLWRALELLEGPMHPRRGTEQS